MTLLFLILATLFLAYSNGANDNFKGVATLFGSGTTYYKRAIGWATATTLAGSVCSIFLAEALVRNFSGKGLVPDALTVSPEFLLAVAIGAGLAAVGTQVNLAKLGNSFFLPLLLSPVIAVCFGAVVYVFNRALRVKFG